MLKTMKRFMSFALVFALVLGLGFVQTAKAATALTHEDGYIKADAGVAVAMSSVALSAGTLADCTVTEVDGIGGLVTIAGGNITASKRGVYKLLATRAGYDDLTLYLVVKDTDETEYVLYEENFNGLTDLPGGWKQGEGTVSSTVANGALTVTTSAFAHASTRPVWLPEYLNAFTNYRFGVDIKATVIGTNNRWFGITFNPVNNNPPLYHWLTRGPGGGGHGIRGTSGSAWLGEADSLPDNDPSANFAMNTSARYWYEINNGVMNAYKGTYKVVSNYTLPYHANNSGRVGFYGDGLTYEVTNIRIVLNDGTLPTTETTSTYTRDFTYPDATNNEDYLSFPFVNVQEPTTGLLDAPTIVGYTTIDPLDFVDAENKPASFMLDITTGLKVSNAGNADLVDVLKAMKGKIIPIFNVSDASLINDMKTLFNQFDGGIKDGMVMSHNKATLKALRAAFPHMPGVLLIDEHSIDYTQELLDQWVYDVNDTDARVLFINNPMDIPNKEQVAYMQARLVSVWTLHGDYNDIMNGVNGIVTGNIDRLYGIYASYTEPVLSRAPIIVGHRGLPGLYPQNTVEGAEAAFQAGAEAVELDIMITTDDVLVNFHDDYINNICNVGPKITTQPASPEGDKIFLWTKSYAELMELTPNGQAYSNEFWSPSAFADIKIPTIKAMLELAIEYDRMLYLEWKDCWDTARNNRIATALKALLDEYEDQGSYNRVVVICFNNAVAALVKQHLPGVSFGALGVGGSAQSLLTACVPTNMVPDSSTKLSAEDIRFLNHRGMPFMAWTYTVGSSMLNRDYTTGITAMTTDDSTTMANIPVELHMANTGLDINELVYLTGATSDRNPNSDNKTVNVKALAVIFGDEFVSINEHGGIRGVAEGVAFVLVTTTITIGTKQFALADSVMITVSGETFVGDDPLPPVVDEDPRADFYEVYDFIPDFAAQSGFESTETANGLRVKALVNDPVFIIPINARMSVDLSKLFYYDFDGLTDSTKVDIMFIWYDDAGNEASFTFSGDFDNIISAGSSGSRNINGHFGWWKKPAANGGGNWTSITMDSITFTSVIISFKNLPKDTVFTIEEFRLAPEKSSTPKVYDVGIKQGDGVLFGQYNYVSTTAEGASTFKWYIGDSADGTFTVIDGATSKTLPLTTALNGKFVKFEVTPKSASATGAVVTSSAYGPVDTSALVPKANNVTITGTAKVGQTLTASYQYSGPTPDTSTYVWLSGDSANGSFTALAGTNGQKTLTLTDDLVGKYIKFCVSAAGGGETGVDAYSNVVGPIKANNSGDVIIIIGGAEYTVSFNSQGGSAVSAQTVTEGDVAVKPADPTLAWHTFGGWYTDAACTKAYDFNSAVNEDITLYAKWTANEGIPSTWAREQVALAIEHGLVPEDLQGGYKEEMNRLNFCRMAIQFLENQTGKKIDDILTEKGVTRPEAYEDCDNDYVLAATALGIVNGVGDNKFAPDRTITRAEAARMLSLTCAVLDKYNDDAPQTAYADQNEIHSWARAEVNFMAATEIMLGTTESRFAPTEIYTAETAIVTFERMYEWMNP